MGWVVNATPGPFYPRKDPVPIVQEAGWAPGPVWTSAGNLTPTGIRSPDRPARNESLYRLSYAGTLDSIGKVLYFQANLAEKTKTSRQAIGQLLHLTLSSDCR